MTGFVQHLFALLDTLPRFVSVFFGMIYIQLLFSSRIWAALGCPARNPYRKNCIAIRNRRKDGTSDLKPGPNVSTGEIRPAGSRYGLGRYVAPTTTIAHQLHRSL